ncbi:glycosyltransferase family protein [Azonexus fungiphilus]|uniref:glycosyltransferase family protein n=1 Tax=Azonexus fungiphilus TaxID=146940 RepID=UPI00156A9303|nr:hypothetical protein [Azonexus fungiphilus]NHC08151.1 hypothetical protein [Azonexus fungiphilus]
MKTEQDIPISFVGSMGNWNKDIVEYFRKIPHIRGLSFDEQNALKDNFLNLLRRFRNDPFMKIQKEDIPHMKGRFPMEVSLIHLITCLERFKSLSAMSDLGLSLYGYPYAYSEIVLYDEKLFGCFDFTPSVTLQDSTRLYNRSKVSLNLPHGHAREGFSWRVCDILASNAVLLSCKQPDLVGLSKGYVKLPMFESNAEAREMAIKLLKDKKWREDLSAASQQMIEDKCRFEPKFRLVEESIGGLSLFSEKPGKTEWLDGTKYLTPLSPHVIKGLHLTRNVLVELLYRETTVKNILDRISSKITKRISHRVNRG